LEHCHEARKLLISFAFAYLRNHPMVKAIVIAARLALRVLRVLVKLAVFAPAPALYNYFEVIERGFKIQEIQPFHLHISTVASLVFRYCTGLVNQRVFKQTEQLFSLVQTAHRLLP